VSPRYESAVTSAVAIFNIVELLGRDCCPRALTKMTATSKYRAERVKTLTITISNSVANLFISKVRSELDVIPTKIAILLTGRHSASSFVENPHC
jgi:hypothetical protein